MQTIILPFEDATGTLTPHVVEALAAGAVSARHDTDPTLITLTFADDDAAVAFSVIVDPILKPAPAETPKGSRKG